MLTFILRQRGKRRAAIPILIASHLNNTIVTATTVASVRLGYSASTPSTSTTMTTLSYLSAPVKGVGLAIASDTLAIANTKDVPVFDEVPRMPFEADWERIAQPDKAPKGTVWLLGQGFKGDAW